MGNQPSQGDRPSFRMGGALGLSRSELDQRCQPSGLYDSCAWDDRAIRRLIGDGKAAARLKGPEFPTATDDTECPICFLYYRQVNVTKCCNAYICTECFLQVRPQKEKHSTCPFCNHHKLNIAIAQKQTQEQIQEQQQQQQQVEDARIRARTQSEDNQTTATDSINTATENSKTPSKPIAIPKSPSSAPRTSPGGFGSSLEQDSRVALLRARSESFASASERSEDNSNPSSSLKDTTQFLQSIAVTPEERRRLEEEMKSQNTHPLTLQIEAEAQQRRMQNDRAYHRTTAGSSRRRPRDWNQIVDSLERGGHSINSLDDLVVLEAAILLSMDEEARQGRAVHRGQREDAHASFPLVRSLLGNPPSNRRRRGDAARDTASMILRGITEEEQMAMAIAASLQDQNENDENGDDTDEPEADQAEPEETTTSANEEATATTEEQVPTAEPEATPEDAANATSDDTPNDDGATPHLVVDEEEAEQEASSPTDDAHDSDAPTTQDSPLVVDESVVE